MSLSSHLKDNNSPVRQFLSDHFPNTAMLAREAREGLSKASTMRQTMTAPLSTIGTSLDYRLRYYFDITRSEDLVAWKGAQLMELAMVGMNTPTIDPGVAKSFFANLEHQLQELNPIGRRLDSSQEEVIGRYCVVLALFEQVYRAGTRINSPLFSGIYKSAEDLLEIAKSHWIDDLRNLSWLFYDRHHDLLTSSVVLNPTFDGSVDVGGADADLILDGCLVDIKTTVRRDLNKFGLWVYQLLGYCLLDYSDQHRINGVGFYMSRQGVLLQWSLAEFLGILIGDVPPPIGDLRKRFQEAIRSSQSN